MTRAAGQQDEINPAGAETPLNKGVILRMGAARQSGPEKTFIVTGVGRGGTSLPAAVLFHAGLYMGHHLAEAVYEDQEFAEAFHARNRDLLARLITYRNATHGCWGFKVPNLHTALNHADIGLFRNPHLIMMFRDPVAIAERTALSEYLDPLTTMQEALDGLKNLIGFMRLTAAPTLLLSYEKALLNPLDFVQTLARFCDIVLDDALRQSLLAVVEPNAPGYIAKARRHYVGLVEHIVDGVLHGWCWEVDRLEPVALDCYADDEKIAVVQAADFRPDLLAARMANGNHGFSLDLRPFNLAPGRTLTVRVAGRTFAVPGSGKTLAAYRRA